MGDRALTHEKCRVKLPKTFVAVNLSDAFSFQEKEKSQDDVLEMKGFDRNATDKPPAEPSAALQQDPDPRDAVVEDTELVPASDALPVVD